MAAGAHLVLLAALLAPNHATAQARTDVGVARRAREALVVSPGEVRARLITAPGLSWVWLGDEYALARDPRRAPALCRESCIVSVPAGRVWLGLRGPGQPLAVAPNVPIDRLSVIRGRYVSRRTRVRRALLIMALSGILGAALGVGLARLGEAPYWGGVLGGGLALAGHVVGTIRLFNSYPRVSWTLEPVSRHAR